MGFLELNLSRKTSSSGLALFAANTTRQESKAEQVGNRHGVPKARL